MKKQDSPSDHIENIISNLLSDLGESLDGYIEIGSLYRRLYATDASIYRQIPLGVAFPKNKKDIQKIVLFAGEHRVPLIPRAAGTSLAGQCVGEGLIVDVSRFMNAILEVNQKERWVQVQPGVIRDDLNRYLRPYGLQFGPNTATANRCMIGGMIGNNSCGSTSIVYGSTRDHVLSIETVLSDGSIASFATESNEAFHEHTGMGDLFGQVHLQIKKELERAEVRERIRAEYPKESITRRNTGYAVDLLAKTRIFEENGAAFNLCKLLCGSEGSLAITTEARLGLVELPPDMNALVCSHHQSIHDSMRAAVVAMSHHPFACELFDKKILDCTKDHLTFQKYRWFVEGDPEGVLVVEFREENQEELERKVSLLIQDLKERSGGYAFPVIRGSESDKVWALRKAGLGLLANIPGDRKAVACIEDTAVDIEDLPEYIAEFADTMKKYGQDPVYYAHAGHGEIHLRPVLNLRDPKDRRDLYDITYDTAKLVKKYKGSLSGEHGDGRVRGPFIPTMIGQENYDLLKRIKSKWDPHNIFNPGKIIDAKPIDEDLRYEPNQPNLDVATAFDFSAAGGFIRSIEKCNGSGDCRKMPEAGGTMCPSYHATRKERDTTRGRANALREFLTQNANHTSFVHPELKEVLDLCLSCKGCTSECPSNVDMARIKAEFTYQYQQRKGIPLRSWLMANNYRVLKLAAHLRPLSNFLFRKSWSSFMIKKALGASPKRSLPLLSRRSLRSWYRHHYHNFRPSEPLKSVILFCDEYTDILDAHIGIRTIELLSKLGYEIRLIPHEESGRAHISKGLLAKAITYAERNVEIMDNRLKENEVLIGLEPSAILSFRDEYPDLVNTSLKEKATALKERVFLVDEFLYDEYEKGNIKTASFTNDHRKIILHGHCHQKALSDVSKSAHVLSIPKNYSVEIIPSGCCGMAGSFGYEKEHYIVSMDIGNLVLFPTIHSKSEDVQIAAPGTSCRHQIYDGTGKKARHPIEILAEALQ